MKESQDKIAIVTNKYSHKGVKNRIEDAVSGYKYQEIPVTDLTTVSPEQWQEFQHVFAVGGDGTVNSVIQILLKLINPPTLIVTPAGSELGLLKSLLDAKTILTIDQVKKGDIASHTKLFQPATVIDPATEKSVGNFGHIATWGNVGMNHIKINELLRPLHLPRSIRGKLAAVVATVQEYPRAPLKDPFIELALTGPYFASVRMFQENDLYSPTLSMVRMQSDNRYELAIKLALFSLFSRLRTPQFDTIADIEKRTQFTIQGNPHFWELNVDDELLPLNGQTSLRLQRSSNTIPIVALLI